MDPTYRRVPVLLDTPFSKQSPPIYLDVLIRPLFGGYELQLPDVITDALFTTRLEHILTHIPASCSPLFTLSVPLFSIIIQAVESPHSLLPRLLLSPSISSNIIDRLINTSLPTHTRLVERFLYSLSNTITSTSTFRSPPFYATDSPLDLSAVFDSDEDIPPSLSKCESLPPSDQLPSDPSLLFPLIPAITKPLGDDWEQNLQNSIAAIQTEPPPDSVHLTPPSNPPTSILEGLSPSPLTSLRQRFALSNTPLPSTQIPSLLLCLHSALQHLTQLYQQQVPHKSAFLRFIIALSLTPITPPQSQIQNSSTPLPLLSLIMHDPNLAHLHHSLIDQFITAFRSLTASFTKHLPQTLSREQFATCCSDLHTFLEFLLTLTQIDSCWLLNLRKRITPSVPTPVNPNSTVTPTLLLSEFVQKLLYAALNAPNRDHLLRDVLSLFCLLIAYDSTQEPSSSNTPSTSTPQSILKDCPTTNLYPRVMTQIVSLPDILSDTHTSGLALTLYSAFYFKEPALRLLEPLKLLAQDSLRHQRAHLLTDMFTDAFKQNVEDIFGWWRNGAAFTFTPSAHLFSPPAQADTAPPDENQSKAHQPFDQQFLPCILARYPLTSLTKGFNQFSLGSDYIAVSEMLRSMLMYPQHTHSLIQPHHDINTVYLRIARFWKKMLLESSGHSIVYSLTLSSTDVLDALPVPSDNLSLFPFISQLTLPYARHFFTPSNVHPGQHLVPDKCNRTPMEFVIGNACCLLHIYTSLLTQPVTQEDEREYVESTSHLLLLLCQLNQRSVADAFTQHNSPFLPLLTTILSWFPDYPHTLSSVIAALLLIHSLIHPDAFTTPQSVSLPSSLPSSHLDRIMHFYEHSITPSTSSHTPSQVSQQFRTLIDELNKGTHYTAPYQSFTLPHNLRERYVTTRDHLPLLLTLHPSLLHHRRFQESV